MALRLAKAERLIGLGADVAVIPECSRTDAEVMAIRESLSFVWSDERAQPDWEHKGVAVFARPGIELTLSGCYDSSVCSVLPVEARGELTLNIAAVWAKPPYAATVHRGLAEYSSFLADSASIVLGDFNSNASLDAGRAVNHDAVDRRLASLGFRSAYHAYFDEKHGEETRPTHYFQRKENRPFHIDYCYLPSTWLDNVTTVTVGEFADWATHSDHVPLVITLDAPSIAPRTPRIP